MADSLLYTLGEPCKISSKKGDNLVAHDYYVSRKAKLLRTFGKVARHMRKATSDQS